MDHIANHDPTRRSTIFLAGDVDATVWLQIVTQCLKFVSEANDIVIVAFKGPQPSQPPQTQVAQVAPAPVVLLRPLGTPPPVKVIQANIFLASSKQSALAQKLKSQHNPSTAPNIDSIKQVVVTTALTNKIQAKVSPMISRFYRSRIGSVFRHSIRRKTAALFPKYRLQLLAVDAITQLLVNSMSEDTYGRVQRDLPRILNTFNDTLGYLELYLSNRPVHWTDIEGQKSDPPVFLKEAQALFDALDDALRELSFKFGKYITGKVSESTAIRMQEYHLVEQR